MKFVDVQRCRLVTEPPGAAPDRVLEADAAVIGGGLGGVAAALALCRAGRTVVLTEETDWLGGQLTAQGVSAPDEHPFIEATGAPTSYLRLREAIREHYRRHERLTPEAAARAELNPGEGWVSRLCFEPRVGAAVIKALLAPFRQAGRLTMLLRHRAVSARADGDRVRSVLLRHLDGEARVEVRAEFFLDATELGDLLPLVGAEYGVGAEGRDETGEPHAPERADPARQQSFTYSFVLERRFNRSDNQEPGTGNLQPATGPAGWTACATPEQPFTFRHRYHHPERWVTYRMFETAPGTPGSFWAYRRLRCAANFQDGGELALINWPGNDFRGGTLLDRPAADVLAALQGAKALSLAFLRWLRTAAPRNEGGQGYPELELCAAALGTADGLAKFPYVRESRRIRARKTVTEQEIAAGSLPGRVRAALFADSVGIGLYGIDIHSAEGEEATPPEAALPFQLPLGALLPVRLTNLLPACKNIGTTRITNGAYRVHPVEWSVGEAAGTLAAFCLEHGLPAPRAAEARWLPQLQRRLAEAGVPLFWWSDLPPGHPAFAAAHLLAVRGTWPEPLDRLEFRPDEPASPAELAALAAAGAASPLPPEAPRGAVAAAVWERLSR